MTSRTTILGVLRRAGYFSSYSHAGKYYTLAHIPSFDERGLWFHGETRFSKHGTLRKTVLVLVTEAPAGHTHEELQVILGLRVHDTLRSLVEAEEIARVHIDVAYLYVAADPERASAQLSWREEMCVTAAAVVPKPEIPTEELTLELDPTHVIDVLVAVIHAPKDDAPTIAARLRAGGLLIANEQVEAVFGQYGLPGKKGSPNVHVGKFRSFEGQLSIITTESWVWLIIAMYINLSPLFRVMGSKGCRAPPDESAT